MNQITGISLLFFGMLICNSCQNPSKDIQPFTARFTHETITIDGKQEESSWSSTEVATFDHHYHVEKESDRQKTSFRMLWDDSHIYLFYHCEDAYITARETQRDGATFLDDCAEIFLSPIKDNPKLHFCFEINLNKVSNDIVFLNGFNSGKDAVIKAYNPNYKVEIVVDGTINENSDIDKGWSMEVAIPHSAFSRMNESNLIKEGSQWSFLALRQNRDEIEGDRRITSIIYPNDEIEHDTHQPKYFGVVEFIK